MRDSKNIAVGILKGLALGAIIVSTVAFPGLTVLLKKSFPQYKRFPDKSFLKSCWYLKKKRLLQIRYKNNKTILEITEAGKKRLKQIDYENLAIPTMRKWDKKWRIVFFDIPEKYKNAREVFRKKLKQLGFYPLQKSMYAHPFDCGDEIDFVLQVIGIKPFVIFLNVPTGDLPIAAFKHFKTSGLI